MLLTTPLLRSLLGALAIAFPLLVLVPTAQADERVPRITNDQLPVAGTCAPIRATGVTHVMVGERTEARWFRVAGVADPVDLEGLVRVLKQRAGSGPRSDHAVWITATGTHAWVHAMLVRNAAQAAGIYRVGLRVRSETTGQVLGFPIFLPPPTQGTPSGKAGLLRVRINTVGEKGAKAASDAGHVYAAAHRALQQRDRFGVSQVVGSLWIATNTPLQYAVQCIDLLYRGGCSGVKLRNGARVPPLKYRAIPKLEIQGGMVSRLPQDLKAPPVQPRTQPWPLEGAARPGWVDLELSDLPSLDGKTDPKTSVPRVRPNYAAEPRGVPVDVFRSVDGEARGWAKRLGDDLLNGLQGRSALKERFVIALRRDEVLPVMLQTARAQFPDATRVIPSSLQFNVFLFAKGQLKGRADVTLLVAGDQVRVISAQWRPIDADAAFTLAPFAVDPFAAGDPSAWRIWFEGLFYQVKKRGLTGWPLASVEQVVPYFPAVARPGVSQLISRRDPALAQLTQQIAGVPYDRLVLTIPRGTATVVAGRNVVGVLNIGLTSEEAELRLDELTPRRAP